MPRPLLTLAWSSSQAGGTLAIGATAWLLSGLTASPLRSCAPRCDGSRADVAEERHGGPHWELEC